MIYVWTYNDTIEFNMTNQSEYMGFPENTQWRFWHLKKSALVCLKH
jgi:hypothetical protein